MNNEDINLNRKGKLRWHSELKKKKKNGDRHGHGVFVAQGEDYSG